MEKTKEETREPWQINCQNWKHISRLVSRWNLPLCRLMVAMLPGDSATWLTGGFDLFFSCACLLSPGMVSLVLASVVDEMALFLVTCAHWEELRSLRTLSLHPKWLWSMLFLLNGFFSSHSLDFMFITKYWTKVSDRTPFSELVSSDCTFFNYPHPNRRRGVD